MQPGSCSAFEAFLEGAWQVTGAGFPLDAAAPWGEQGPWQSRSQVFAAPHSCWLTPGTKWVGITLSSSWLPKLGSI